MTLFIKTFNGIVKVNKLIAVASSGDNFLLDESLRHFVLLVDNNIELGMFKNRADAEKELENIYHLIKTSQFSVTNVLIYDLQSKFEIGE